MFKSSNPQIPESSNSDDACGAQRVDLPGGVRRDDVEDNRRRRDPYAVASTNDAPVDPRACGLLPRQRVRDQECEEQYEGSWPSRADERASPSRLRG